MRKKILAIIVLLFITFIVGGFCYLNRLMPIITGYAAKNLASGIFVANRSQESMEGTDLNFSFIKYTSNKVDYANKVVTSSFLWSESKAIFIDGFGCVLLRDSEEVSVRSRQYTVVPLTDINPDTIPWPSGNKITDTIPSGVDMYRLNIAIARTLKDTVGNTGTYAVAIAYKNQLIAENYRAGFSNKNRFISWSMAKSFTNTLVGIMVKKGLFDINKPVDINEWKNDNRARITLNNLMHMNSGLEWNEDYGNASDVNLMLHNSADMAHYTFMKPLIAPPDSLWYYSSGTTNIVSYLIRRKLANDSDYYGFPRRELFNPIGMRSAIFEVDASGTFSGSSYLYASMRDYIRFGLLYMNNGNWLGNQILPENWVKYTTQIAKGSDGQYGAFFWLNKWGEYPNVPTDMFMCRGHDGQFIYIIPSLQLVVVRTGFSKQKDFDNIKFISNIVATVKKNVSFN